MLDQIVCAGVQKSLVRLAVVPEPPGVKTRSLSKLAPVEVDHQIRIPQFDAVSVSVNPDAVLLLDVMIALRATQEYPVSVRGWQLPLQIISNRRNSSILPAPKVGDDLS